MQETDTWIPKMTKGKIYNCILEFESPNEMNHITEKNYENSSIIIKDHF